MRVDRIMTKQVSWCGTEDSLAQAAQLMWNNDCGCLPVCSGNGAGRVVGVITDRDICMSALFKGKPLSELRVDELSHVLRSSAGSDEQLPADRRPGGSAGVPARRHRASVLP